MGLAPKAGVLAAGVEKGEGAGEPNVEPKAGGAWAAPKPLPEEGAWLAPNPEEGAELKTNGEDVAVGAADEPADGTTSPKEKPGAAAGGAALAEAPKRKG